MKVVKPDDSDLTTRFLGRRAVTLIGLIEAPSAARAIMQMLYLHNIDKVRPIRLVVDSRGGDVDEALRVIDVMRYLGTVGTHCSGTAEGAAAVVVAVGRPGWRTADPTAQFRLTKAFPGPAAAAAAGSAEQLARELAKLDRVFRDLLVKSTGQPAEVIDERMTDGRRMPAAEAIALGLVERLVEASWLI
jgi:ATP-dependent Clp protease protease subunit